MYLIESLRWTCLIARGGVFRDHIDEFAGFAPVDVVAVLAAAESDRHERSV